MCLLEKDRAEILRWAKTHSAIESIFLVGSRARGSHRPDSDIDLVIKCNDEGQDWLAVFDPIKIDVKERKNLKLSHPVDIVPWSGSDTFRMRAQTEGIRIYPVP